MATVETVNILKTSEHLAEVLAGATADPKLLNFHDLKVLAAFFPDSPAWIDGLRAEVRAAKLAAKFDKGSLAGEGRILRRQEDAEPAL